MIDPALSQNQEPISVEGLEHFFVVSQDSPSSTVDPGWTLSEAAKALGVTERTVRRWIKEKRISAEKIDGPRGPEWRISTLDNKRGQGGSINVQSTPDASFLALTILLKEQAAKLEAASFRNGFLENRISFFEEQMKLLPDFQSKVAQAEKEAEELRKLAGELSNIKSSWWFRFWSWFSGIQG